MKRILLLSTCMLLLFSCEYQDNGITSIDDVITSDYLLTDNLDTFVSQYQIVRLTGKPGTTTISIGGADLSKYEPCFVLYVATGTTPETTATSAIIKLDGMVVLTTSDFSKNGGQYKFEVCNLCPTSVLTVEVRGEPGSYVSVWIEGKLKEVDADGDGYTVTEGDCDDTNPSVYPGAEEICSDGIDQDCNGTDMRCPEDIDDDGDGFTENQGDCNDGDASIYPGATEIAGDGIDQDCNGTDAECPPFEGSFYVTPTELKIPRHESGSFTVVLSEPAGPCGVQINISSEYPYLPSSLLILPGDTSASLELTWYISPGPGAYIIQFQVGSITCTALVTLYP